MVGRPGRSADHYDFCSWINVGADSLRSEVNATGAGVVNCRVGEKDIVRWDGYTAIINGKLEFAETTNPKITL